jgi:hypothetical protein
MNKLAIGNFLFSRSTIYYVISMVVCALAISFVDSLLPQGVSVGEAYTILVLIGLLAKDSRMVTVGAIVGTVLTLEGFYISEHGVALWIVWVNRLLAIFIIWAVAVIALSLLRLIEEQEESEKIKAASELLRQETSFSQLLREISILSNSSDPVEDALKQSMQKICEFTGCPVGHIYIMNSEEDMLRSSKIWVLEDWEQFREFKTLTEATDFRPGIGLPGRVLASNKVSWIKDLKKDSNFPRADIAMKNGLKSGFAFPVLIGRKIIAVMEFYSKEILEEHPKFVEFAETLSFLLGRPFERDHAGLKKEEYENHLRRLYTRMKAVREEEVSLGNSSRIADKINEDLR